MKILSVNFAQPRVVKWKEKKIRTSIFKKPSTHPEMVNELGLINDSQCEPKYHGGNEKALYSYDIQYYELWKKYKNNLSFGAFGENLSTVNFTDDIIMVGNIYQCGEVIIKAMEPRIPCFKLNIAMDMENAFDIFYNEGNFGTYFSVLKTGLITSGDQIKLLQSADNSISIADVSRQYISRKKNQELCRKIIDTIEISENLKNTFRKFIKKAD